MAAVAAEERAVRDAARRAGGRLVPAQRHDDVRAEDLRDALLAQQDVGAHTRRSATCLPIFPSIYPSIYPPIPAGAIIIPTSITGTILGGYLIKRFNWHCRHMLRGVAVFRFLFSQNYGN